MSRRVLWTVAGLLFVATVHPIAGGVSAQSKNKKGAAPEVFRGTAKVSTATAGGEAHVSIEIDRYTPEKDLQAMEQALKSGGSAAFLEALKRAPVAGRFKVGDQTFTIRWARERPSASGRVISVVTDTPVYFVGAGVPGAKPRAGFDVAVVLLNMDSAGVGQGTLALAAKVKPGGTAGVEVEDYASEPVKLVSVFRVIS
jgi:hypothetical protein